MKKFLVASTLCLCSFAMHGQKTRLGQEMPHAKPGDSYPVKVHISETHYRTEYVGSGQTDTVIYANAVIDGQKVELRGTQAVPFQTFKLPLGDHQARLLKDLHKVGDSPLLQEYELVLSDGTIWRCTVTGLME